MTSTKKLDIKDAINLCNYNVIIRPDFIKLLQSTYSNPKNNLYLFERNEGVPKLFLLKLYIPVKYNKDIYDINILVYFPLNFPQVPPDIYFHKTGNVKINPKCKYYIDEDSLKINYSVFHNWDNSLDSFKRLINDIYNQFNTNFPIFNLRSNNNDINRPSTEGDCILKKNLCKEIELINPNIIDNKVTNIGHNKNNSFSNQGNNNINNNFYRNNPNNIIYTTNNINNITSNQQTKNGNQNTKIQQIQKKFQNYNSNTHSKTKPYDENIARLSLINLLFKNIYPKICSVMEIVGTTSQSLEIMKNNINEKINELKTLELKSSTISKTVNSVKKELLSYNLNSNKEDKNIDLSNLDSVVMISNKDYYIRLAKEKAIEEYLLVIKKSYEKHKIDLHTAIDKVRTNSRNIFFIKYKNEHPYNI